MSCKTSSSVFLFVHLACFLYNTIISKSCLSWNFNLNIIQHVEVVSYYYLEFEMLEGRKATRQTWNKLLWWKIYAHRNLFSKFRSFTSSSEYCVSVFWASNFVWTYLISFSDQFVTLGFIQRRNRITISAILNSTFTNAKFSCRVVHCNINFEQKSWPMLLAVTQV